MLAERFATRAVRIAATLSLVLLASTQVYAIAKTEKLIAETGGRGRWSNPLDASCQEKKDRSDLVIASLHWGFNEQVAFLADQPQLVEPFGPFLTTMATCQPCRRAPAMSIWPIHPSTACSITMLAI